MIQTSVKNYSQSDGESISALEHCRKTEFRIYLHLTQISKIVTLESDFMSCTTSPVGLKRNGKLKFSI